MGRVSQRPQGWQGCQVSPYGVPPESFFPEVCFGFDSLAEELDKPMFSAMVASEDVDEDDIEDDDETLCACITGAYDPLEGCMV